MLSKELTLCTLLISQLSGIALGRDFFSEEYNTIIDEFDDGYFEQANKNEDFSASRKMVDQHLLHENNPTIMSNTENFETSNVEIKDDVLARHKHHLDVLHKLRDVTSHLKDNLEDKYAQNQFNKPERFKKSDPNYVQVTNYYKGSNPFDNPEYTSNKLNKFSHVVDPNGYNDYEDVLNLAENKEHSDLKKSSLDIPMMLVRKLLERNNAESVEPIKYATSPHFSPCHHEKNTVLKQNKPHSFIEITEDQPNFDTLINTEVRPKISRDGKELYDIMNLFGNNTEYAINVKLKVDIDIPQLSDNFKMYVNKGKNTQGVGKNVKVAATETAMDLYPSLITFPFFQLPEAFNSNKSYPNGKISFSAKNSEISSKRIHKKKKVKPNSKVKHYNKMINMKDRVSKPNYYNITTSMVSPKNESEKEIRENEIPKSTEKDIKNEVREIKEVYLKHEDSASSKTDLNDNNLTVPMIVFKKAKLMNETNHDYTTASYSHSTRNFVNNITNEDADKVTLKKKIVRYRRSLEEHLTIGNLTESDYYAPKNEQDLITLSTISDKISEMEPITEAITTNENVTKIHEMEVTESRYRKNFVDESKNQIKNKLKDSEKSSIRKKPTLLLEKPAELNKTINEDNKTDSNLNIKNNTTVKALHIKKDIPKSNIREIILDENRYNSSIILKNSKSLDEDRMYWTNRSRKISESRIRRDIDNHSDKNMSTTQAANHVDEGIFGEVDWSDVDTIAPSFIAFIGNYMTGTLTLCSDITCHSMKCDHRQCLHRWCPLKERDNKTGHCTHNKENKVNSKSMTTLKEMDLPTESVMAIVEVLERKLRDKLFGKVTLCSSKNCITILADEKQFHKFRCSKKKLDRKEHCIEAKKITNS